MTDLDKVQQLDSEHVAVLIAQLVIIVDRLVYIFLTRWKGLRDKDENS